MPHDVPHGCWPCALMPWCLFSAIMTPRPVSYTSFPHWSVQATAEARRAKTERKKLKRASREAMITGGSKGTSVTDVGASEVSTSSTSTGGESKSAVAGRPLKGKRSRQGKAIKHTRNKKRVSQWTSRECGGGAGVSAASCAALGDEVHETAVSKSSVYASIFRGKGEGKEDEGERKKRLITMGACPLRC